VILINFYENLGNIFKFILFYKYISGSKIKYDLDLKI